MINLKAISKDVGLDPTAPKSSYVHVPTLTFALSLAYFSQYVYDPGINVCRYYCELAFMS